MIRRRAQAREEVREAMRGGLGKALLREYIAPGEMTGVEFVSVVTLEPGASVGEHIHEGTEELYLVLEGSGVATLDAARFDVGQGDSYLVRDGHSHGLENGTGLPLTFVAVLTKIISS
jgi:mannose-6-phosphate isomerase-like protein (cupin superfamily)